jgi:hypothetical protein
MVKYFFKSQRRGFKTGQPWSCPLGTGPNHRLPLAARLAGAGGSIASAWRKRDNCSAFILFWGSSPQARCDVEGENIDGAD